MLLINCEINLILTWTANFAISGENRATIFATTVTKLYALVVFLSNQHSVNSKLLQQLKSGFKRTTNSNKYQSKLSPQAQNQYLDFLIDLSFQGTNKLSVLSFENDGDRTGHI